MKKTVIICLFSILLAASGLFAGCSNAPTNKTDTTLTFSPKEKKQASPEEKKALQEKLKTAADKENHVEFAKNLKEVYANGWQGEKDFTTIESETYVRATNIFTNGEVEKALDIGNTIHSQIYESWRFKYLKVRALEKLGTQALEKGDLDKAKSYATQIMSIEFRPEGVNLMAKTLIAQAETAIKAGDKAKAKSILTESSGMEISAELRQKIDEMMKGL